MKLNKSIFYLLFPLILTSCGGPNPDDPGTQDCKHKYNDYGICELCNDFNGQELSYMSPTGDIELSIVEKTKSVASEGSDEQNEVNYLITSPVSFTIDHESRYYLRNYFISDQGTNKNSTKLNLLRVYEEEGEAKTREYNLPEDNNSNEFYFIEGYVNSIFKVGKYYAYFTYDYPTTNPPVIAKAKVRFNHQSHEYNQYNVCTICNYDSAYKVGTVKHSYNYFQNSYDYKLSFPGNSNNYQTMISYKFSVDESNVGQEAFIYTRAHNADFNYAFYLIAEDGYIDIGTGHEMTNEQKGFTDNVEYNNNLYNGYSFVPQSGKEYLFVITYKRETSYFYVYGVYFNTHINHHLDTNGNCDLDDCDYTTNELINVGQEIYYSNTNNGKKLAAGFSWDYRTTNKIEVGKKYSFKVKYSVYQSGTLGYEIRNENGQKLTIKVTDEDTSSRTFTATANADGYLYFTIKNTCHPTGDVGSTDNQRYNYIWVRSITLTLVQE